MIKIPRKSSESPGDLHRLLCTYIQDVYEEDPAKYTQSIQQFADLRSSMLSVESDLQGKDILFKYFGQLDFFGAHFTLDEQQLPIKFTWKDVFNGEKVGQASLAYEKACTIFNMAACVSQMAATQNRLEETGLKTAFNYFQCSGGVFQYIADNFLHSPTTDLSKECIQFLSQLMLAQAQEVFCEKAVMDKKKTGILAKLLQQCYQMYFYLTELAGQKPLAGFLPAVINLAVQWKAKYFNSLASYYQSLVNEVDGKFGEQVGRLELADSCAKDCMRLAKDISSQPADTCATYLVISSSVLINALSLDPQASSKAFSVEATAGKRPGQVLADISKSHQAFIEGIKVKAAKENDIIYHESVLKADQLPAIDKINMTKTMKMTELFPNIGGVVGPDLFLSLIPMAVHEKSSVYSEAKAGLIRSETARVNEADESLIGILASYNYPQFLVRLKSLTTTGPTSSTQSLAAVEGAPKEVLEWSAYIQSEEQTSAINSLFSEVESVRSKIRMDIERTRFLMAEEEKEFGGLKDKLGNRLAQTPPATALFALQTELGNYQRDLDRGAEGDRTLGGKFSAQQSQFDLLRAPDRLNQHYIAGGMAVVLDKNAAVKNNTSAATVNLLDLPIEITSAAKSDATVIIKQIEECLSRLDQLRRTRKSLLSELKERLQRDDISESLVLGARKPTETVIKEELQKFNDDRQKIQQTIAEQHALVKQLERDHESLSKTDVLGELEKLTQARANITQSLKDARVAYDGIKSNLKQGLQFYRELAKCTEQLVQRLQRLTDERRAERQTMQVSISDTNTDTDTKLLSDKLAKLSALGGNSGNEGTYLSPVAAQPAGAPAVPSLFTSQPTFAPLHQQQPYYAPQPPYYPVAQPPGVVYSQPPPQPFYAQQQQPAPLSLPAHLQQPLNPLLSQQSSQTALPPQPQPHYGYPPNHAPYSLQQQQQPYFNGYPQQPPQSQQPRPPGPAYTANNNSLL